MIKYQEDDLYKLLLNQNNPQGAYNHSVWEIYTKGELDSDAVLLTSIHESMHNHLNNGTAYGLVLTILAHLARENMIKKRVLFNMVKMCRTSHEIFATYTSLLILSPQGIKREIIEKRYPSYKTYLNQASSLMGGVKKNHLQYALINSFIRVCFQNPELINYLKQDTLLNIKNKDSPDSRLLLLSKYLNETRLNKWLQKFVDTHKTPLEANRFIELEDDLIIPKSEATQFNLMGQSLSDFIYEEIRNDKTIGFSTMYGDEHLTFLDDLLKYANNIMPINSIIVADKEYNKINALLQHESEIVFFNTILKDAIILPFSEYPIEAWKQLLVVAEGEAYIYIVSRVTERLLEKYNFSKEDIVWLMENHSEFLTAVLIKQIVNGIEKMVFLVFELPSQIEAIYNNDYSIICNSDMILSSDSHWKQWGLVIEKYTAHTYLFDLSPSIHIERSIVMHDTIIYNSFHLEVENGEYAFVILLGKSKQQKMNIFFMPCSPVMSNLLLEHLSKQGKSFSLLDPEKDLSDNVLWLLRVQMTRLLDESRFDFMAEKSKYADKGFEDDRF